MYLFDYFIILGFVFVVEVYEESLIQLKGWINHIENKG